MSGPAAGDYDPRPATVQQRTTTKTDPGEVGGAWSTYTANRYIRFAKQTSLEVSQHHAITGTGLTMIRMRRDSVTELITPAMRILHGTKVFGILGYNNIPNDTDEVEFNCQQEQPS